MTRQCRTFQNASRPRLIENADPFNHCTMKAQPGGIFKQFQEKDNVVVPRSSTDSDSILHTRRK